MPYTYYIRIAKLKYKASKEVSNNKDSESSGESSELELLRARMQLLEDRLNSI